MYEEQIEKCKTLMAEIDAKTPEDYEREKNEHLERLKEDCERANTRLEKYRK